MENETKMGEKKIPSYLDLLKSLPPQFHTTKVKEQLHAYYNRESENITNAINRLIEQGKPFAANLYLFRKNNTQYVAEFDVKDLSRPEQEKYNFHLQNISQWVYAGCILFSVEAFTENREQIISTHH